MRVELSETRKKFPLSRRIIFKRTMEATVLLIVVLLAMYFFGLSRLELDLALSNLIVGGFILLVIIVAYLYESSYYSSYFYDLTDHYLIIKKEPIMPREITVPYERISSVTIDRDLFDILLGLWDLHVNTSATAYLGMEAHIDGLSKEAATGLKNVLTEKMKEAKKNSKKS